MAITLAEARANRDGLAAAIKAHKADCAACGSTTRGRARPAPCGEGRELAVGHKAAVSLVKTWFAPGPDQGVLG